MSEVNRYWVPCNVLADQSGWHQDDNEVVLAGEHDVALDAQRLRADTAEAERDALHAVLEGAQYQNIDGFYGMSSEACREVGEEVASITMAIQRDRNSSKYDLAAAEQRIAELEADKARIDFWQAHPQYAGGFAPSGDWSFFSREMKTCYGKDLRAALDRLQVMHAALNPKPEA